MLMHHEKIQVHQHDYLSDCNWLIFSHMKHESSPESRFTEFYWHNLLDFLQVSNVK
ncbi:Uncharacterised protein [Salmonella enterica subsp. salamae]|uniref:Uncharacterized protein n=1 Tax=Salmonella enterica subsp. salamae serovar Sofia TaxID=46629 RepID=I7C3D1_SALER|nr:hypothetical protein SESS1296_03653 [Salmonella enterica subsp. salamae serovar Sofia]SQH92203.1 Uncharacterised protein [Salmonella enterica subsp. salamae]